VQRAPNTIRAAIAAAKNNRQHTDCYALLPVAAEEVEEAATHSLDIAGYVHVIDGSAIRHTFKNHGNPQKERARGQIAITDADFEHIAQILATPERVIYGLQNNRGAEVIGYIKAIPDGTLAYLESVRTKKSTLAMQTMWKYPRGTSAASIEKALRLTSGTARGSGQTVNDKPAPRNFAAQVGARVYSRKTRAGLPAG